MNIKHWKLETNSLKDQKKKKLMNKKGGRYACCTGKQYGGQLCIRCTCTIFV